MKLGTACSTLVLLSALALTGCGADDDTAPSASDAPTSSSSTSASASAQAKAGEYQPATENGPAQNVPRPQKPEGMDVESVEGLEKFLNYWFEMRDYAIKTGETSELYKIVETSAKNEQKFLSAADTLYNANGWIVYSGDDPQMVLDTSSVESNGKNLYSIKAKFSTPNAITYNSDKTIAEKLDTSEANQQDNTIIARYTSGKWSLVNIEVKNQ